MKQLKMKIHIHYIIVFSFSLVYGFTILTGCMLTKPITTWKLGPYNYSAFTRREAEMTIARSFDFWNAATERKLRFTKMPMDADVDIEVTFLNRLPGNPEHTNVVAQTFLPCRNPHLSKISININGKLQFSLWRESIEKFSLFHIMTHEIGHAIGLGHTSVENAIMYGFNNPKTIPTFTEDDRLALQTIYKSNKKEWAINRYRHLYKKHE